MITIISARAFNPNPTPEQLKKREQNRLYLERLKPSQVEVLRKRKREINRERYRDLIKNDPDFILENRQRALDYHKDQSKKDPGFIEKNRNRIRDYYRKIRKNMEENEAMKLQTRINREPELNQLLWDEQPLYA